MKKDKKGMAIALTKGVLCALFLALVFYRSLYALFFTLFVIPYVYRRELKIRGQKRRVLVGSQFKEALDSMLCALRAGYSAENAFREAQHEMEGIYGKKSVISEELYTICRGLDSRIPLEELLAEFAGRTDVDAIREFSSTFAISRRSGGNMTGIMEQTIRVLQDGMAAEREIELMLAAGKTEQRIMNYVPFLILGYVGITTEGFFDALYGNAAGILVMSVCMAVYLFAFALSERIADIRV